MKLHRILLFLSFATATVTDIDGNLSDSKTIFNPNTGLMIINYSKDDISNFVSEDIKNHFNKSRKIKWSVLGSSFSMFTTGPGLLTSTYIFYQGELPDIIDNPIPILLGIVGAPYLTYLILPKLFNNISKNENYKYLSPDNQNYYNDLLISESKKIKKQLIRKGMLYWFGFILIASSLDEDDEDDK